MISVNTKTVSPQAAASIQKAVAGVIKAHANSICEAVMKEYSSNSALAPFKYEIHNDLILRTESIVIAHIEASGGLAWILEFGSGSKMDLDNPYLSEYMGNRTIFNNWRPMSLEIATREAGTYTDLDGKSQTSNATHPGYPLEGKDNGKYKAIEPMHIIKKLVEQEITAIEGELAGAIQDIVRGYILDSIGDIK